MARPAARLDDQLPFWEGVDTSYASYRTEVFGRWPTTGSPSAYASRADYDEMVAELVATGSIDEPARLYWDVRPSAKYPTLEFRIADVCTSVDDAVLLAGLVRGVVGTCANQALDGGPEPRVRPELLRSASWRAARHGLAAELVDLRRMRSAPAGDVLDDLVAFARLTLEAHDDLEVVTDLLSRLLATGTSAQRQRAVLARERSLASVVRWLVEATCADC